MMTHKFYYLAAAALIVLFALHYFLYFFFLKKQGDRTAVEEEQKEMENKNNQESEQKWEYLQLGKLTSPATQLLFDGVMADSWTDDYSILLEGKKTKISEKYGRKLADLSEVFTPKDCDEILDKIEHRARRENFISFHIKQGYLILLYADEINNGRWYCEALAIWELPELKELREQWLSLDPTALYNQAFNLLYCPNNGIVRSLASDHNELSAAVNKTKASGALRDNRDYSRRALASINTIHNGGCRCAHHSSDPYCSVRALLKHDLITVISAEIDKANYCQHHKVRCELCLKHYDVTEQHGGHMEHYVWNSSND